MKINDEQLEQKKELKSQEKEKNKDCSTINEKTNVNMSFNKCQFKCIFGFNCLINEITQLEYPQSIENVFMDNVISYDFFKCPIIIKEIPNCIYDKLSIFEWFSRSNINPLSGVEMKNKIQYVHVVNLFAAGLLLEKNNNKLIFHVPDMSLQNFLNLSSILVCEKLQDNIDFNKWINYQHRTPSNNYMFTLEHLLLCDNTGKFIIHPVLNENGLLFEKTNIETEKYIDVSKHGKGLNQFI